MTSPTVALADLHAYRGDVLDRPDPMDAGAAIVADAEAAAGIQILELARVFARGGESLDRAAVRLLIYAAIRRHRGVQKDAARELGLSPRVLHYRLDYIRAMDAPQPCPPLRRHKPVALGCNRGGAR